MSATSKKMGRTSVPELRARKGHDPIVCLTAYTAPMAQRLDEHCDLLLVGDSLGMVVYGMESTLAVTVDMMVNHGKAVMRGSKNACVVVDLPFGSYQESKEQAFRTASHILAETGRDEETAMKALADVKAVADAGAFSVVVEGTVEPVARQITEAINIPTIGIGASVACDGQVLVTEDILGLFSDFTPKFVKRYANLGDAVSEAVGQYADEVRTRQFPTDEHCFGIAKKGKLRAV